MTFSLIDFQVLFANDAGKFDLDVTTFQMAVLYCWNERPRDRISFENLRLATELPDGELRRTLWVNPTKAKMRDFKLLLLLISLFFPFLVFGRLSKT